MSTYVTISGDSFEIIARKKYGTEQKAGLIQRANPGLVEPFISGTTLQIPPDPGAPKDKPQKSAFIAENEVAVLISGKRFRFWDAIKITRSIDSMDVVEFGTPFEEDAEGFKETFRPFSFPPLDVTVGGEPFFTGTMVGVNPQLKNKQKILSVSGYSLPGVLSDCTVPASAFPLEYNDQNLNDIATAIAGFFGLTVVFEGDSGPVFERVSCAGSKKALSFLVELAKQRNFIINSTELGALRFTKSVSVGSPVAVLMQGESPVLSVTPAFTEREYYSHITGMQATIVSTPGTQFTATNPFQTASIRPLTFEAPDTEDSNVKEAVNAKLGRMFGNIVSYALTVDTWRDPAEELWKPNTTIKLNAPGAMIYGSYEFIVRSVTLIRESSSESAVLTLTLPGAFSGELPEALPWG